MCLCPFSGNQCFIAVISYCCHDIYGVSYCEDLIYKSISKTPMFVCHGIWHGVLQDHHQAGGMYAITVIVDCHVFTLKLIHL